MQPCRKLTPTVEKWLKDHNCKLAQLLAGGFTQTPKSAREGLAFLTSILITDRPQIAWYQDDIVPGDTSDVPIRMYHPKPESHLPLLIYFHGGGGMAGSIAVYDPICRKLALSTSHIIVSVDYRLAPEFPYPAGLTDAIQVVKNIWETLDSHNLNFCKQLNIGGDSGGGALCASVAHSLQHDPETQIKSQVLIYPGLDYTMQSESMKLNGKGYLLETDKIGWYYDNYFQHNEDRRKASPLYMEFSDKLPRSLVVTAEFCPLRDEGIRYAEKMKRTNITTRHLHFEDMIHAFLNMEDLAKDPCTRLYREIAKFLNSKD